MILSFGPDAASGSATAWALALPTLAALLGYLFAAFMGEARESALRGALLGGWLGHALAILIDIAGVGAAAGETGARFGFAPALSVTMWLVLAVYVLPYATTLAELDQMAAEMMSPLQPGGRLVALPPFSSGGVSMTSIATDCGSSRSPSHTSMRTSSTPRFFSSVRTCAGARPW